MAHAASTERFAPVSASTLTAETKRYFVFFNLSVALIAITFIELILIILPFHKGLLYTTLVVLSLAKFVGVVWYFMHLRWDRILLTLLFILGLTLAGGTVAALLLLFEAPPPSAEVL
jgi:cytochrome c oxidase subunit 4